MSKNLSRLQTVSKVARIICKICFVLCIIGAVGCLLGLVGMLTLGSLAEEIVGEGAVGFSAAACFIGLISCVGELIFFRMAEKYFEHELEAGTPFTHEGAKEMCRLGKASLIIALVTAFLGGLASGVVTVIYGEGAEMDITASITPGLVYLLLSVIFHYGTEMREKAEAPQVDWTPIWETPVAEEPVAAEAVAEEAVAEEAPVEEAPVEEAPVEEAPAEETDAV